MLHVGRCLKIPICFLLSFTSCGPSTHAAPEPRRSRKRQRRRRRRGRSPLVHLIFVVPLSALLWQQVSDLAQSDEAGDSNNSEPPHVLHGSATQVQAQRRWRLTSHRRIRVVVGHRSCDPGDPGPRGSGCQDAAHAAPRISNATRLRCSSVRRHRRHRRRSAASVLKLAARQWRGTAWRRQRRSQHEVGRSVPPHPRGASAPAAHATRCHPAPSPPAAASTPTRRALRRAPPAGLPILRPWRVRPDHRDE